MYMLNIYTFVYVHIYVYECNTDRSRRYANNMTEQFNEKIKFKSMSKTLSER